MRDMELAMMEKVFHDYFNDDYDAFAAWCEDEGYPVVEF